MNAVESDDLRRQIARELKDADLAWRIRSELGLGRWEAIADALIAAGLVATPTPAEPVLTRDEAWQVVDIIGEHLQAVKHPEWHTSCAAIATKLRAWMDAVDAVPASREEETAP